MADYGFGTGGFGSGPFGNADLSKDALWELTIPQRNKDDDALVGGDLEDFLGVVGQIVDDALIRAQGFPLQGDPVTALSGTEGQIVVNCDRVDLISGGQRVTVSESDRELVERVFPQSVSSSGLSRRDGWLAVIGNEFYRVTRVRSHDLEAIPYGAPTIDIKTNVGIGETLTLQPPDLLTLLGTNVGVLVDKADPPDYTRRNILRHRLLRDLKVSERLFRLLGSMSGFDVEASGLYCISKEWYDSILVTNPNNAFRFGNKYYTDLVLKGHLFDEVPADIIPLDTFDDFDVAVVTISDPVEESENLWCMRVTPVASVYLAEKVGFWQIIDALGTGRYIERLRTDTYVDEDTGVDTDGTTGPFALSVLNIPIDPGSLVVTWQDGAGNFVSAIETGTGDLVGAGTGTVDYDTGSILLTPNTVTENPGDILVTYNTKRLCVLSLEAPPSGIGSLRAIARFACRSDYRRAAAYRVVTTPNKVLSEPGVDFAKLIDRMEQKIDKYVPIHIRFLMKVFRQQAVAGIWPPDGPGLITRDLLSDPSVVNLIGGALFDVVPADAQPLDEGVFLVSAQIGLNELNWLRWSSGTSVGLNSVTAYDDGSPNYWAVGSSGVVLISDGSSWSVDGAFPSVSMNLTGVVSDYDFVGGTGNVAISSEDQSSSLVAGRCWLYDVSLLGWVELDNAAVDRGLLDCAMSGESNSGNFGRNALFVGYDGRMFYNEQTTDVLMPTGVGITTANLNGCDMPEALGNTFVVGDGGTLLHVTSWGANPSGVWGTETWADESVLLGTVENLRDIVFSSSLSIGVIVGDNDSVFITSDTGSTWASIPTGSGKNFTTATWGDFQLETGQDRLWIFSDDGTSYVSDDLGVTWVEEHLEDSQPVRDAGSNSFKVAVGDSGAVWRKG